MADQGASTSRSVSQPASAKWIAGRIQTLLSHYYQPGGDDALTEAALTDWVRILGGYDQRLIDAACNRYLTREPKRRPTPAAIRDMVNPHTFGAAAGDRSRLSADELELLENKILPTARRWLSIPGLAGHGKQTLALWGEE